MSVLYIAVPVASGVTVIAILTCVTQVRSGQFDDHDTVQDECSSMTKNLNHN